MTFALPDTEFGARAARHLSDDVVAWLTIVDASGTPQPTPVWFLWDGSSILVYSKGDAKRLAHLRANPRVAFHFDSVDAAAHVVVLTGEAVVDEDVPPVPENPEYLAKYGERITRGWGGAEQFASIYSVPLRIRPTRVRGF
ncbi:TIGR03667 family PPOX class F420-dependent oxidoreductase [Pseudonocardia zijingensis]|jgi:PPOX class probable F420-dependent enzyme|uniref:Pyridoxamine 5'-phosphate oxidase N-terminal domain-containing protein n=1 Tax=Pseudonocardia zijingensis TaxID=153376 RepID=A0ABN1PPJ6_9PSEU